MTINLIIQQFNRRLFKEGVHFSGGYGREETPVPIPNTEVKLSSADGTAWVTVWESKTLPGFIKMAFPLEERPFIFYGAYIFSVL